MARLLVALVALALHVTAQDTTSAPPAVPAETTINVLAGTLTSGFVGSIISASGCDITLAMQCTNSSIPFCSRAPGVTVTITHGPAFYGVAYTTSSAGASAFVSESCQLEGASPSYTRAVCTGAFGLSSGDIDSSTTTLVTFTDPALFTYGQVPITAGADKLPSGSQATCTGIIAPSSTGSADTGSTSTTGNAAAAAATAFHEVYKVFAPIGAAIVAGAGVLI